MRTRCPLLCVLAALASSMCACQAPVGQDAKSNEQVARRSRNAGPAGAVPLGTDSDAPVAQMRVNAEVIPADTMWRELADEIIRQRDNLPPDVFPEWLSRRAAQWISEKVTESLLYQRAELMFPERAGKGLDNLVDAELRKFVTRQWDGVQRRLETHLAAQGRSLDDLREKLKRDVLVASYLDGRLKPLISEPTRDELLAFYRSNLGTWQKPPRRSMSLIEVRVLDFLPEGVSEATREQSDAARNAAREKIAHARARIEAGEPFADVAREVSSDSRAPDGGAWGWITAEAVRERYLPAVEALNRLNQGELSEIIPAGDSFFLVRCDEFDPGFSPSFVDMQEELKEQHEKLAYNRLLAEELEELQKTARIEPADMERYHAAVVTDVNAKLVGVQN